MCPRESQNQRKNVTIRLNPEFLARLETVAKKRERTVSEEIRAALTRHLADATRKGL